MLTCGQTTLFKPDPHTDPVVHVSVNANSVIKPGVKSTLLEESLGLQKARCCAHLSVRR